MLLCSNSHLDVEAHFHFYLNIPFSLVPSEKFLIVKDDGCNNLALVELTGCTFLASCIQKLCRPDTDLMA
jgi:hypothetical protein